MEDAVGTFDEGGGDVGGGGGEGEEGFDDGG